MSEWENCHLVCKGFFVSEGQPNRCTPRNDCTPTEKEQTALLSRGLHKRPLYSKSAGALHRLHHTQHSVENTHIKTVPKPSESEDRLLECQSSSWPRMVKAKVMGDWWSSSLVAWAIHAAAVTASSAGRSTSGRSASHAWNIKTSWDWIKISRG